MVQTGTVYLSVPFKTVEPPVEDATWDFYLRSCLRRPPPV
jgi:hypothetical protein